MNKKVLVVLAFIVAVSCLSSAYGQVTSLKVTKTATGECKTKLEWDVAKKVTPEEAHIFKGDSQEVRYDVLVTQTGSVTVYSVSGVITIVNDDADTEDKTANIQYVDDAIEWNDGGSWVQIKRERLRDAFTIPTGETETIEYTVEFDPVETKNYRNVVYVGLDNHAPAPGRFKEFLYRTDFTIPDTCTLENECVDVVDSLAGPLGTVCGEGAEETFTYTTILRRPPGCHKIPNTVTAGDETATAVVKLCVYELGVSKTAIPTFNRNNRWTIDKVGDRTSLILSPGQQFPVTYQVLVDVVTTDQDFEVVGSIDVSNPAPIGAELTSIVDTVSPDIVAKLDCTLPAIVPAADTLVCNYMAILPDKASRTNTVVVKQQNYDYAYDGTGVKAGVTGYSASAPVNFGTTPENEADECITVTDTHAEGPQGEVVCKEDAPKTFTYTYMVGPYAECGEYKVPDTASFVTNDSGATGSDSWLVTIKVPCDGCTLTQGYWKTHSKYGPAPYDDTWAKVGEDTAFFHSGQSYIEVLHTPPQGGNAYYILGHQYIAAELNNLNGADFSAAEDAFEDAKALLSDSDNTPDAVGALKGGKRNKWIRLAEKLEQYNSGIIGPGHCDE